MSQQSKKAQTLPPRTLNSQNIAKMLYEGAFGAKKRLITQPFQIFCKGNPPRAFLVQSYPPKTDFKGQGAATPRGGAQGGKGRLPPTPQCAARGGANLTFAP